MTIVFFKITSVLMIEWVPEGPTLLVGPDQAPSSVEEKAGTVVNESMDSASRQCGAILADKCI
jgi:hypothetical protein